MRCDQSNLWTRLLLGASVLLQTTPGMAEKPKDTPASTEWIAGKRLTPNRSEAYRLCAGTTVRLGANSSAEVQSRIPLPTSADGLSPYAYSAQLTSGRIDITVDPKQKPASSVLIHGPRRVSVLARGGRVTVVANGNAVAVGVFEGKEASIGIGATWKHVVAGNMLVVSPEAPQGMESKLPVAPVNVSVNRPALAVGDMPEPSIASWDPVPQAKRYLVSIENVETKSKRFFESTQSQFKLLGLDPGRHLVRVSSVEATGLSGVPSQPAVVNVVGLELPPGAFISQGKVYLEALQQLKLTHVDGLEATYDRAAVYFKAVEQASLRGKQATTLHLRIPGAKERLSLELVPRALHTQVDILPATARWPRDKVVVRVLVPPASSGSPSIELVPNVTVNNQTVELDWERTAQSWQAVLPAPPTYPGPWVLRAEVTDQHGNLLGRNFLEIASTAGLNDEDIPREIHRGQIQVQAKR